MPNMSLQNIIFYQQMQAMPAIENYEANSYCLNWVDPSPTCRNHQQMQAMPAVETNNLNWA